VKGHIWGSIAVGCEKMRENMTTPSIREGILEGFLRVAKDSRAKVRTYLLKRVGVSSHDVRIMIVENTPITASLPAASNIYAPSSYNFKLEFSDFQILNVSGTSPVIIEFHVFVKAPSTTPLVLCPNDRDCDEQAQGISYKKSFLPVPSENNGDLYQVPCLERGKVLYVSGKDFRVSLRWKELFDDYEQHHDENSEVMFQVDRSDDQEVKEEWRSKHEKMENYCNEVMAQMDVWVGVVLDSKELLPFKWNHTNEEFVQGFFYVGTTVS
jgi:hypothetical protein